MARSRRNARRRQKPARASRVPAASGRTSVASKRSSTSPQPRDAQTPSPHARFVTGSILGHILVMTGTGALGLMALFIGDLANLLFLGQLGDTEVLAAVGFASSLLFFSISIGIGMSIATTAVVSPAIGAGRRDEARRLATSAMAMTALVSLAMTVLLLPFLRDVLGWLGATGRTRTLGTDYLSIVYPKFPLLALGMSASSILRSVGDARRAMFVTLSGAILNVILDPIFILVFKMGLYGAAWASVLSRVLTVSVGLYGVAVVHGLLKRPSFVDVRLDATRILAVGIPVVATNLATPASNAFVTKALAGYGDAAMAAWSVGGRVNPVAFGAIFALTSSIGPIIGQNFGARNFARVRETVTEAVKANIVFTAIAWLGLALSPDLIIRWFGLAGASVDLIYLFCWWLAPLFMFLGFLFIANAVFNTLRHPHYATIFNWARATLGTIPFVILGGHWYGAPGVFIASMAGGIVFGIAALWTSYRLIAKLEAGQSRE